MLAPLVTSNSERILTIKSVAISSSRSSNCCSNASIISSSFKPWSIFSIINASWLSRLLKLETRLYLIWIPFLKFEDSITKTLEIQPPNLLISIGEVILYIVWNTISLISTLTDCIDWNKGISKPLCSKNGLICSINGFTVSLIISSISWNKFSPPLNKIGVSKSVNGYTLMLPFSSNSHVI